jgi:2'-5' RNA ligase
MRLFVALGLPKLLSAQLCSLTAGFPGARWVPYGNHHLTLRFIGETGRYQAEEIDLALAGLRGRGFMLEISGVGCTEKNGRPVALYAAIMRNPALELLQSKIENALQRAGLAAEKRRFFPHISLARLDQPAPAKLAQWVQTHNLFRPPLLAVEGFSLFSSQLGHDQAIYTEEADYALQTVQWRASAG